MTIICIVSSTNELLRVLLHEVYGKKASSVGKSVCLSTHRDGHTEQAIHSWPCLFPYGGGHTGLSMCLSV
jgi:hypothetical protein